MNFHELVTKQILEVAAQRNEAEVFAKPQVAEVFPVNNSGIPSDLFSYALKAHFDFVVTDKTYEPLFAVEFDGPHHAKDPQAQVNDIKKNQLCDYFGLPLARVRDEHIFQAARGLNYLTWLTELFFAGRVIEEAYESGIIPPDDYVDAMSFATHPHIKGNFPLFISAESRVRLFRSASPRFPMLRRARKLMLLQAN